MILYIYIYIYICLHEIIIQIIQLRFNLCFHCSSFNRAKIMAEGRPGWGEVDAKNVLSIWDDVQDSIHSPWTEQRFTTLRRGVVRACWRGLRTWGSCTGVGKCPFLGICFTSPLNICWKLYPQKLGDVNHWDIETNPCCMNLLVLHHVTMWKFRIGMGFDWGLKLPGRLGNPPDSTRRRHHSFFLHVTGRCWLSI